MSPMQLAHALHHIFSSFDKVVQGVNFFKMDTVGDVQGGEAGGAGGERKRERARARARGRASERDACMHDPPPTHRNTHAHTGGGRLHSCRVAAQQTGCGRRDTEGIIPRDWQANTQVQAQPGQPSGRGRRERRREDASEGGKTRAKEVLMKRRGGLSKRRRSKSCASRCCGLRVACSRPSMVSPCACARVCACVCVYVCM